MKVIQTEIEGVVIIEPDVFGDDRGYFFESYNQARFDAAVRPVRFVQDNESKSKFGVLRGLHFQCGRAAQSKLVRVVKGKVLDVAVDIRRGSPTFGRHVAVELTAENKRQFFVPRGFAHGFSVLSDEAVFQYKCDNLYAPESEGAIAWNDPAIGIDVIVNCAAYTNVDRAEEDEAAADRINRLAVGNLARAAAAADATLIHVSTDYVFSGDANRPYDETCETHPLGVYGRTKLAGEAEIEQSGCKSLIVRTAWLYSEFGHNFLKTMLRLTAERDRLTVVFDQAGTPTYAGDLARTIFDIVESGAYAGREGVYHFSNEGVCSWYDFAHAIAAEAGHTQCTIEPCHSSEYPSKVERPAYSVLDKSKIKATFGVRIPHWTESLKVCMKNLKNL